jgi:nitrogen fixation NifU-like protein
VKRADRHGNKVNDMDGKEFDFWQDHSLRYLEMAFRTERHERLTHPDGYGTRTGDCGDTVTFYLTRRGDRIGSLSFEVNGCMNTNACANAVAEMAEGRALSDGWKITPESISNFLETLPDSHRHCAELAAGAFYLALSDAEKKRKQTI